MQVRIAVCWTATVLFGVMISIADGWVQHSEVVGERLLREELAMMLIVVEDGMQA